MMSIVGLFILKQRVNKLTLIKELQVLHTLAQTNLLHGHLQLVGDTDHHTALGRTVELRDGER